MASPAGPNGPELRVSVAAAARRVGVAPATLRTWDRRYGIGPTGHRMGEHRRYTEADLARLEAMRRLLVRGASAAEAARAVTEPAPVPDVAGAASRPRAPVAPRPAPGPRLRPLREAVLRMDADRVLALLAHAVEEHGVRSTWDGLLRPALAGLGERWAAEGACVAEEHLLSECATRVLHAVQGERAVAAVRPVLLASGPGEAHVLPLHALAAALAERSLPSRVLGAATPPDALATAMRQLRPSAVVLWSQQPATAPPELFAGLPRVRGGCALLAGGPGWEGVELPGRVIRPTGLADALRALADDGR